MTTVMNPYEALYTNLKNRFTVIHNGTECTVGDFLHMKAGKSESSGSSLPIATAYEHHSLQNIVEYVNDKLTVKEPPVKDATIRRFPLRTSASALLSSVAACALVLSCGIYALTGTNATLSAQDSSSYDSSYTETVENGENTPTSNEEIIVID